MNKYALLCLLTVCSLFAGCSSSSTAGTPRLPWEIKTYSQVATELQDVDERITETREDLAKADSDEERQELSRKLWLGVSCSLGRDKQKF